MAANNDTTVKKPKNKEGATSRVARFFRESRSEFKKIVWPTTKTVFKNTGITLAMIAIIGGFVALLDYGLLELLSLIMNVAK